MQDELVEQVARAAYIAHHKTGPWEDALDEPNMGRGGYKTEVARWHSIARDIIPIVQADCARIVRSFPAPADDENTALRMERLKERIATAIRNQEQTDGRLCSPKGIATKKGLAVRVRLLEEEKTMDVDAIIAGLSEAQKRAILGAQETIGGEWVVSCKVNSGCAYALARKELAEFHSLFLDRLTETGLAVRARLMGEG